ncbi:hypothetical protein SPWS13_1787 [Shewanella putrefaciens]|nr:hypothetical protein SPWS13_1787 [Shewanella putrefaciens]
MFAKSITIFPFGDISGNGQSKIWERKLDIPYLGDGFLIRIWGTKEGQQYPNVRHSINSSIMQS